MKSQLLLLIPIAALALLAATPQPLVVSEAPAAAFACDGCFPSKAEDGFDNGVNIVFAGLTVVTAQLGAKRGQCHEVEVSGMQGLQCVQQAPCKFTGSITAEHFDVFHNEMSPCGQAGQLPGGGDYRMTTVVKFDVPCFALLVQASITLWAGTCAGGNHVQLAHVQFGGFCSVCQ